jgi:hypothetical protein
MKTFISILSIIDLLVIMMIGPSVLASNDTATVNATVTVQNISVSVSDGTVAYGNLSLNSSTSTCDLSPVDTQIVTNNGNVAETFNVMGSTSTNWSLGTSPGSETYVHKFSSSTCPVNWSGAPALTLAYQTLVTNVATSATSTLNLQVTTPTATSYYTQQSFSVTVQAIAY